MRFAQGALIAYDKSRVSGHTRVVVSPVRASHPEFGYIGTSSFCRIPLTFLVCGLIAGASGVAFFKAAPRPDSKDAMALATGATPSSIPDIPVATVKSNSDNGEFAEKAPDAGAIARPIRSSRPRSMQAVNERPPIAAVPIGHTDRPAVPSSDPAVQLMAMPEVPPSSSDPTGAAAAADPSIASPVPEAPARVASAGKRRAHSNHVRRHVRSEYSRSANYGRYYQSWPYYQSYYQGGYIRIW
jgi:hypothetical protein